MKGKSAETTKTEVRPSYPGYENTMNQMGNYASGTVASLGQPYQGQLTANMSPMQNNAYSNFQNYMNEGGQAAYLNDPLYQQARDNVADVMGGKYLGQDSPMMQYVRNQTMTEDIPEAQAELSRRLGLRGNFYSSAANQGEQDILTDAQNYLQGIYANNYNNELNRMMGMTGQAMGIAQNEQQVPLNDINLQMQMGDFPRQLQQADLNAQYQEALRQRDEELYPLKQATAASQIYPKYEYQYKPGQPSMLEQIMGYAQQGMGMMGGLGNMFGGGSTGGNTGGFFNTGSGTGGNTLNGGMGGFSWGNAMPNQYVSQANGGMNGAFNQYQNNSLGNMDSWNQNNYNLGGF